MEEHTIQSLIQKIIQDVDKKHCEGIALMGSYATGRAGIFSDVDVVCFRSDGEKEVQVRKIENKYVVVSHVHITMVEKWFRDPVLATEYLGGAALLQPVWDPNEYLRALKHRAKNFRWSKDLQEKANAYACRELVLLGEEVNKGIQGMLTHDTGRMLNSLFGLCLGLVRIERVRRGVLQTSDNDFYPQLAATYAIHPEAIAALERMFGVEEAPLPARVRDGLLIYRRIALEVTELFTTEDLSIIKMLLANMASIMEP